MSTTTNKNSILMNKDSILALCSSLGAQLASLRIALGEIADVPDVPAAKMKKAGRPPKAVVPSEPSSAPADGEVKPKVKRALPENIAVMNSERNSLFTKMRNEWIERNPTLAESAKAAWAEDASKATKKSFADAVKAGNVERPPQYPDVLKAYSQILAERNPERAAAKAAAKVASETGSEGSAKKRGRPKQTDEEKAAKKAAKKAAAAVAPTAPVPAPTAVAPTAVPVPVPVSVSVTADAASVVSSDSSSTAKKRGRPKMTEEEKAAAKTTRKANALKKAATVPLPPSPPDTDYEEDSLE